MKETVVHMGIDALPGNARGDIARMGFNFNGNSVIKECDSKGNVFNYQASNLHRPGFHANLRF
jgi:hypothetical protein